MTRLKTLRLSLPTLDQRSAKPAPKEADGHYASPAHAAWRATVIRRAGGVCQGPGCGRQGVRLFADHVVEIADGGARLDPANGQALCGSCHTRKTNGARARRQAERVPVRPPEG